jgi:hypothetical protein
MTVRTQVDGQWSEVISFSTDSQVTKSKYETLQANTDLVIDIPVGCLGVQVYHNLATPVFFKIGAAVTLPTTAIESDCGYFQPGESARTFFTQPAPAGLKLHLRCANAGDILREFWG